MKFPLWRRRRHEEELEEEIQSHLRMAIRDRMERGESAEEAEMAARREFGNVGLIKETTRGMWGFGALETVRQDIRYGVRLLWKNPVLTLIAIFTLALGIGANTAIFGVVNTVLLRPSPFKDPERLVMVWDREAEAAGGDRTPLAVSDLLDLRAQSRSFADIEAFTFNMLNYTGGESPEQAPAGVVSAKFFSMLGVQPQLGRTFSPDEERPGAQRVVLLSDRFWRKHFAADPQVVGRAINLGGQSYNVIGVMPANLDFLAKSFELWVALQLPQPTRRGPHFLIGMARLKSDVSLDQARDEVMNSLKSSFTGRLSFNILPVNEAIVGDVRPALLILLGIVSLVTLIAVVNVTNLMLAQSAARVKEISIRFALGAGRVRIIRQLLTELALAVMLLIGAGLCVKSFWRLRRVDSGVNIERTLTMQIALFGQRYADRQKIDAFFSNLLDRVKALPGVRAAAVSNSLPPDSPNFSDVFTVEGRPANQNQIPQVAFVIRASPDYFGLLGVPLRRGRYFSVADSAGSLPVAMINETTARQFFQNEDPIGKRINIFSEGKQVWREVVGVVGDVKYNGMAGKTQPAFYEPLAQAASPFGFLIVKTEASDPLSLAPAARNEVKSLDRELPVSRVRALEEHFALSVARPRFQTTLVGLFAALALILASVGIYGVISYSVTQRTHEMGVRIALGARSRDVLMLVVKQGMTLIAIGVAIGLAASLALTRLMKTLLFDVSATDTTTFVLIPLPLAVVALVACWIPARRATKVDPMIALRCE